MHTIEVSHVARPEGSRRENPPHLHDLREFVDACEGLPDDAVVRVTRGASADGGRYALTLTLRLVEPVDLPEVTEEDDSDEYQSWLRRFSSGFSRSGDD
jgi:hypothetical protein